MDNNLIKIKLWRSPNITTSKTYEFKMGAFKSAPLEGIQHLLTNFDNAVAGTGTLSTVGKIALLKTLLQVKALQEYYLIITTFGGTTVRHLQEIRKGLLKYLFLSNTLAEQKRSMMRMMRNPIGIKLRQLVERIQELNNILSKFLGSEKYMRSLKKS